MYLHPVALLSLATFVFAYSIRKSRLVRILNTHSLHSIRARKSQKVACVCDVAFEQYRSYTVKGLSGIDNYNVSVAVNISHGMMMSDPITVYGKSSFGKSMHTILYYDICICKCLCDPA